MPGDGELPSAAEMKRLEAEATELLRADARAKGSKTGNRRGFTEYAKKYGLMQSTYTKYERTGFSEQQLEELAHTRDKIVHVVEDQ